MANGRPPSFKPEIANEICERLAEGQSLRRICVDEHMPSQTAVYKWLLDERYASFVEQYTRARELQADTMFDEILDIVDDGSNDWMEKHDSEGGNVGWRENGEAISRSRLRMDARKWMAGKLRPKKYGEKQEIDLNHGVQDSLSALLTEVDGRSKGIPNG